MEKRQQKEGQRVKKEIKETERVEKGIMCVQEENADRKHSKGIQFFKRR